MMMWVCDNKAFKTYDEASAHAGKLYLAGGAFAGIEHLEMFGPFKPSKVAEPFGPDYWGELGKDVANFRKLSRAGLADISPMSRRGYGNAVLEAIRGKQAAELRRAAVPIGTPNNASGTWHQSGADILKAIKTQNATRCRAAGPWTPADQKRADQTYAALMVAKRGIEAAAVLENVEWCKAA